MQHRPPLPGRAGFRVAIVLGCLWSSAGAAEAQTGQHVDPELGFEFRPPSKWAYLGAIGDRGALRAIYGGPRALQPRMGGAEHTPTLRVLWFPTPPDGAAAPPAGMPAEGEPTPEGEAPEGETLEASAAPSPPPRKRTYTSVADYLARVHGPNTRVTEAEPEDFGAFRGLRQICGARHTNGNDLTMHSAVLPRPGGELVIEFEVLSEQYDKLRREFDRSLATLASCDAGGRATPGSPTAACRELLRPWREDRAKWAKRPAEARAMQRAEFGSRFVAARAGCTEPGWRTYESDSFLVQSRADPRTSKQIAQSADRARAWIDQRFAGLSDEVVMPAVIRVFADQRELDTYRNRWDERTPYLPAEREILFYKDASSGNTGEGSGDLLLGVLHQYLDDKHPLVRDEFPSWLRTGLRAYLDSSRVKGAGIEFFASEEEIDRFRIHEREGDHPQASALVEPPPAEVMDGIEIETPAELGAGTAACSRLVRFLIEAPPDSIGGEGFLLRYLRALGTAAVAIGPDPGKDVAWAELDPKASEALRKAQLQRRHELLTAVHREVQPGGAAAWQQIDAAFLTYNKKFRR